MSEILKRWLVEIGRFRAVLRASENELFSRADNVNHYQRAPSRPNPPSSYPAKATCPHTTKLTPVVTALSRSPNQTTLLPLIPPCPSASLIGEVEARGSYILIFLSLEV